MARSSTVSVFRRERPIQRERLDFNAQNVRCLTVVADAENTKRINLEPLEVYTATFERNLLIIAEPKIHQFKS